MAIVPTGAIYKSLVFDGESSRGYGIYITGQAVYNAPDRDVEMINIPGRNGSFALDKGRFQNIEVTYPAGIFADNEADFAQGISDFRNFLCSRNGYVRLTDEYNPDEYRMAVYKSGLDVSPAQLKAGEFQIVFDCKPQRYLLSGEEPITIGEWHETETASGSIASFEAKASDAVKSLVADINPIQSLNGYDKPWSGGNGKNKFPNSAVETQTQAGITIKSLGDGQYTINGTETSGSTNVFPFDLVQTVVATNTQKLVLGGSWVGTISFLNANGGRIDYWSKGNSSVRVVTSLDNLVGASVSKVRFDIAPNSTHNSETAFVMLVDSSVTDTTFEPYSNICPISGHTEVNTHRTGVNVWDEEWEVGGVNTNTGANATFNNAIRSKNYIPIKPNVTYYGNFPSAVYPFFYDADKNYIGFVGNGNTIKGNAFTIENLTNSLSGGGSFANACYMRFRCDIGSSTYNHNISINYPSTDHEYHAYNGTTYVTDLNGTRYGGTLDVVSGELVVDRAIVDLGTLNWRYDNGGYFQAVFNDDAKHYTSSEVANAICSNYAVASVLDATSNNGYFGIYYYASGGKNYIRVLDEAYTDATAFTSAMSGVQLCYELATPTTVQLTAQEVELLVGLNQVWANSGDVSVEYGTAPNVLINPTLFESSPMLEVEGYGTIAFNGYEIELENYELGNIPLAGNKSTPSREWGYDTQTLSSTYSIANLNGGDVETLNGVTLTFGIDLSHYSGFVSAVRSVHISTPTSGSFVFGITSTGVGTKYATITLRLTANPTFGAGTPFARDDTAFTFGYDTTRPDGTAAGGSEFLCHFYVEKTVTGQSETLTITFEHEALTVYGQGNYAMSCGNLTGYSTVSLLGHPTYIDCDLGECYRTDHDEYISLNHKIDLGSDLPKLASGANEITYDNTITDLKVVPRWWKI